MAPGLSMTELGVTPSPVIPAVSFTFAASQVRVEQMIRSLGLQQGLNRALCKNLPHKN